MTSEMRKKLARDPFEEKIRKVGQLIHLVKTFPRRATAVARQKQDRISNR
jgi:hypothetical protein